MRATFRSFLGGFQRGHRWTRLLGAAAAVSLVEACTVGPDYLRPPTNVAADFKEQKVTDRKGWKGATPLDLQDRGAWWAVYKDPTLSDLAGQVELSNQTVAASLAAYDMAKDVIREGQAGFFPTVTNSYSATGSHQGSALSNAGRPVTSVAFSPAANATWDIDVWGRIRRTVESDAAAAQVSAADLQNAKLSAQAALATAYFELRATDALKKLYERTASAYRRTLEIVKNQMTNGTASRADVDTAETQLLAVEAQAINTGINRAQYEHAIAVLVGKPPAGLTIPITSRFPTMVPAVPAGMPSRLLERRPDIAAAERTLQQYNALIGVAVASFYPDLNLTAVFGFTGGTPLPISAASEMWSVVGTATQPIFDGGLRSAQLEAAKAAYRQNVANYRQTVLTAFQQVEDELAALRILAQEAKKDQEAIKAAREAVEVYLNQYKAGTVAFTTVVTAQASQLTAEESLLAVQESQLVASVALVEALGGGWNADQLPDLKALAAVPTITPPL
ncbi:MAG: efflux transporter outer membrane subunit [Beijerinckiaceae bacterium]|nr:efflux transporter outer membrane subunit [Beijerinckiaceae bacterium]